MIIDLILDRKDDIEHGVDRYNPREFYHEIVAYEDSFEGLGQAISRALDTGEEEDVKAALKQYIDDQEYSEHIKDFIDSVSWLNEDIDGATESMEAPAQITGKELLDAIVDGLGNDEDFVLFMQNLFQSLDNFNSLTKQSLSLYLTIGFVDTMSPEEIDEFGLSDSTYYYYDHGGDIKPTDNPMELFLNTPEPREYIEKALSDLLSIYNDDYVALYNDKKESYENDDDFLSPFLPDPAGFGLAEDVSWAKEADEVDLIEDFEKPIDNETTLESISVPKADVLANRLFAHLMYAHDYTPEEILEEITDDSLSEEEVRAIIDHDFFEEDDDGYNEADDDMDSDISMFDGEEDIVTESDKPGAPLIGADGNIFSLMGIAQKALRKAGMKAEAEEMIRRITSEAGSYDEALNIIGEYVEYEDSDESY